MVYYFLSLIFNLVSLLVDVRLGGGVEIRSYGAKTQSLGAKLHTPLVRPKMCPLVSSLML